MKYKNGIEVDEMTLITLCWSFNNNIRNRLCIFNTDNDEIQC